MSNSIFTIQSANIAWNARIVKKCEKCKDSFSEWCEMCKACKKLSGFCKECNKICEYCKCCLDKYEEIISIPSEYHISKVLD